jgi:hypothetical protein
MKHKPWTVVDRRALAYNGNIMFQLDRMLGPHELAHVYMTSDEVDGMANELCDHLNATGRSPKKKVLK